MTDNKDTENEKQDVQAKGRIWQKLALAFVTLAIIACLFFVAEAICKKDAPEPEDILAWTGGGGDYFMYDPTLGWRGTPSVSGMHRSKVVISHNAMGFRDTAWDLNTTKKRVLLLGVSNMWGYGVKDDEYPAAVLNRINPEVRWFNAGMNGYGTDQAYLCFKKLRPLINPDWTVLVVCGNDRSENTAKRVRTYNKPYFVVENGDLVPKNMPVPRSDKTDGPLTPLSVRVFRKTRSYVLYTIATRIEARWNREAVETLGKKHQVAKNSDPTHLLIRKLFDAADKRLLVVPIASDAKLAEFCKKEKIPFLDLSKTPASQPGSHVYRSGFPKYGHWTPEGNRVAAEHIGRAVLPLLNLESTTTVSR